MIVDYISAEKLPQIILWIDWNIYAHWHTLILTIVIFLIHYFVTVSFFSIHGLLGVLFIGFCFWIGVCALMYGYAIG